MRNALKAFPKAPLRGLSATAIRYLDNQRDMAEKYPEALRRALEKADGLDVTFDKHMTDRTGKYIVFRAN